MNKLPMFFRHNIGLKILSVFIAIVIWYAIVSVNDPVITRSYSVHINVTNDAYIANGTRIYTIEDDYKSVYVYVRANRSTLRGIHDEDINVEADLTQIVDLTQNPAYVPLKASCPGVDSSNITMARATVPITISQTESKEFPVAISTGNSAPAKDYEIGHLIPSQQKIVISGPETIINSIDSVVANIDVSDMSENKTLNSKITLIDKNQAPISETTIQDDLSFEGGYPNITVDVELWRKVADVQVHVETVGTPYYGYQAGSISTVPETITVAGSEEALQQLAEMGNAITVPVSVEGAMEDVATEIQLSEYLPDGIKLSENTTNTASINVSILPYGSQEIQIDVEQAPVAGLEDGLTVSYEQKSINMIVKADDDYDIDDLGEPIQSINLDLTGKTPGDYTVSLSVQLSEGYIMVDNPEFNIKIKKAA